MTWINNWSEIITIFPNVLRLRILKMSGRFCPVSVEIWPFSKFVDTEMASYRVAAPARTPFFSPAFFQIYGLNI